MQIVLLYRYLRRPLFFMRFAITLTEISYLKTCLMLQRTHIYFLKHKFVIERWISINILIKLTQNVEAFSSFRYISNNIQYIYK